MRILVDENLCGRRLSLMLQSAGHDVVLATSLGLASVNDARVLACAALQRRALLTRDHGDFAALHDLVATVGGHHSGILVVRFDNDPKHNLTERGIVTAIGNLVSAAVVVNDAIHVLNHCR